MTAAAIIIVIISFLYLFAIEPRKSDKSQYAKFAARYYAHRGLYEKDQSVPENSLTAFDRACEKGYGIELDVHLLTDGVLAVVHDDSLKRVCGEDIAVSSLSSNDIKKLRLFGTDEKIPLFSEVLDTVGGRVPLIIEMKTESGNASALAAELWRELSGYKGLYCVESFDPRAVAWFNRRQPNVYRGQLVLSKKAYSGKSSLVRILAANVFANFIARPHFVAHDQGKKTFSVKLCEFLGARSFVWAVSDPEKAKAFEVENDGVIFEFFEPRAKYYKEL